MSVADTPALLEEARRGDNDACARLIEENAGLIWSIVRRYSGECFVAAAAGKLQYHLIFTFHMHPPF